MGEADLARVGADCTSHQEISTRSSERMKFHLGGRVQLAHCARLTALRCVRFDPRAARTAGLLAWLLLADHVLIKGAARAGRVDLAGQAAIGLPVEVLQKARRLGLHAWARVSWAVRILLAHLGAHFKVDGLGNNFGSDLVVLAGLLVWVAVCTRWEAIVRSEHDGRCQKSIGRSRKK